MGCNFPAIPYTKRKLPTTTLITGYGWRDLAVPTNADVPATADRIILLRMSGKHVCHAFAARADKRHVWCVKRLQAGNKGVCFVSLLRMSTSSLLNIIVLLRCNAM